MLFGSSEKFGAPAFVLGSARTQVTSHEARGAVDECPAQRRRGVYKPI